MASIKTAFIRLLSTLHLKTEPERRAVEEAKAALLHPTLIIPQNEKSLQQIAHLFGVFFEHTPEGRQIWAEEANREATKNGLYDMYASLQAMEPDPKKTERP